ncbi:MarR family transcriptional regulator [Micromonospora ureilytica]|uniref:MarR family winged helix-turn-helix transcriptional regulator n=1 Tax=Micromonospora ureilytica TaxID=709868 RepID=UPI0033FA1BF2
MEKVKLTDDALAGLTRNLHGANRVLNRALTDALSQHRLLPSEFEVLRTLAASPHGTLRIGKLVSPSTTQISGMSRLIERMIKQRLVTRENSPDDRRVQKVSIAPPGRDRLRLALAAHDAAVYQILDETGLNVEESGTLTALLAHLTRSARAAQR